MIARQRDKQRRVAYIDVLGTSSQSCDLQIDNGDLQIVSSQFRSIACGLRSADN